MMDMEQTDFYAFLESSIQNGQNIKFILDSLYNESENRVEFVITKIMEHYQREDLITTVYTCVKELVINGMKANAKRVFFEKNNLDPYNEQDYKKGISLFRDIVQKGELENYLHEAKTKGLYVEIDFEHDSEHTFVRVINNVELTETEKSRIETKMHQAMKYDDIAQFYMDSVDDMAEEGAGMGLTMIILMMKGQELSLERFKITTQNDKKTIATLDFPFS